jgi:hypothetical protein
MYCSPGPSQGTVTLALSQAFEALALLKVLYPWPFSRNCNHGPSQGTVTLALLKVFVALALLKIQ